MYVALNSPWRIEDAVAYARNLARELTPAQRGLITHVRGSKARSGGRVLADWAQNHSRATAAAPYTARVRDPAPGDKVPGAGPSPGHRYPLRSYRAQYALTRAVCVSVWPWVLSFPWNSLAASSTCWVPSAFESQ